MTPWVPGSLAYCCLFPAVVPGRCNRQGPITKSPSEGETMMMMMMMQMMIKIMMMMITRMVNGDDDNDDDDDDDVTR